LFAARLKQLRLNYGTQIEKPGLSARQFANILGIAAQRYRRYERAEIEPPLEVLALLRRLTGVSLDRLVAGMRPGDADMVAQHGERDETSLVTADRLRMSREAANLSIKDVAELMKLEIDDWLRWEADLDTPPIDKLVEYAARFSVTIQFLTDGELTGLRPEIRQMLVARFPELEGPLPHNTEAADQEKHTA
jgi:transcriptional regulator with XRE-family HTH domain